MNIFDPSSDSIVVVGLGYVGIPLSLLLARKYKVIGFDTDDGKVKKLIAGKNPITEPGVDKLLTSEEIMANILFTSDPEAICLGKIKIITVGTPYDVASDYIDYGQLEAAVHLLNGRVSVGDIIILKSTVPPGTTNGLVKSHLENLGFEIPKDIGIAFSPERMVEGQAVTDFLKLPKIVGASDKNTSAVVSEIIGSLGGKIVEVSSPETAEMVKMIDNYSRFVFLGLTNEIALISEKVGVDVFELLAAAKLDYPRNSGLLLPGPGVGGSCLNKDPYILKAHLRKKNLQLRMVDAATAINRSMPAHVVDLVDKFAGERKKVAIAGVAFKGDTDDTRFTSSFEIEESLKKRGFKVFLSDPYVKNTEYQIIPDIYEAAKETEIFLLLADHSQYKNLDLNYLHHLMISKPLFIDTRGIIKRKEAVDIGFEYYGVGRL